MFAGKLWRSEHFINMQESFSARLRGQECLSNGEKRFFSFAVCVYSQIQGLWMGPPERAQKTKPIPYTSALPLCIVSLYLYVLQLWKLTPVLSRVWMWQICSCHHLCHIQTHHLETELPMLPWIVGVTLEKHTFFFFFVGNYKIFFCSDSIAPFSMPHLLLWYSCHYNQASTLYSQHYYSIAFLFCWEISCCPCVWPLKWSDST